MTETLVTPDVIAEIEGLGTAETLPPKRAFRACQLLGPLARWWLPPDVREKARQHDAKAATAWTDPARPPLSPLPGACVVLCVWDPPTNVLTRAFPVVVRWRRGEHSDRLPLPLRIVADDVRGAVAKAIQQRRPATPFVPADWGLEWAEPLETVDPVRWLASDRTHFESGWASLAAGLIAGSQGLSPRPGVWASGAWGPNGLRDVSGLDCKLASAHEWGASELFVPVWRQAELAASGCGVNVRPLAAPASPDDVLGAIGGLVAAVTGEPDVPTAGAADEERVFRLGRAFYLFQPDAATRFYRSHLLDAIIRRVRTKMPAGWYDTPPARFVTLVSFSPEVAVLTAKAVGAERTLLLFSEQTEATAKVAAHEIPGAEVADGPLADGPGMTADILRRVAAFVDNVPAERVVIDIKPGTKRMTYDLSRAAQPGSWLFCLETTFLAGKPTDPGTERPDLWRVV